MQYRTLLTVALVLERARNATARYHDVRMAVADGYVDINVVRPNMGRHWTLHAWVWSPAVTVPAVSGEGNGAGVGGAHQDLVVPGRRMRVAHRCPTLARAV
jgi:hypothetical protein